MSIAYEIRRRARLIVGPVLGISLCAYFAYHLVQGDRGLTAWLRLTQQVRDARTTLAAEEAERLTLERRSNHPPPQQFVHHDLIRTRPRPPHLPRPKQDCLLHAKYTITRGHA